MKIQVYSVIVGTTACNARCPFCVSKMTPKHGLDQKIEINWRNFRKGCLLSKDNGVSTVMITGKGEPLLYPEEISEFLEHLAEFDFPFIELQTNGILIEQQKEKYLSYLNRWYELGLTTISISIVSHEYELNKNNYQPNGEYMDLHSLIVTLHEIGFSVRLSVIMHKGGVDSREKVEQMINFAKENDIEQLSLRELAITNHSENVEVWRWTKEHLLEREQINEIQKYVKQYGVKLMELFHGAQVYDVNGQNVCLTNALTIVPDSEEIRQLIFFPDGHLRFDWQYKGAILI